MGLARIHVHGESLGGWVAAQFAIDHPAQVAGLTLDTAGGLDTDPAVSRCRIAGCGGHEVRTPFVPRGVVHGFSNSSGRPAKCLCILTPGRIGPEYFRELAAQVTSGAPDPAAMREIMNRYGLIPAPPAA